MTRGPLQMISLNAIFVNVKHKKTYGLIGIAIAIALLVFVCLNFRLMRVDKLEIVDVDVNDWLEEVVNKEKARSTSSSLFIHTHTTRNSIVAQPSFPSTCDIGDSVYGGAVIEGVKLIVSDDKLEDAIPVVFEKTGEKTTILKLAPLALYHTLPFLHLKRYSDELDEYHFKYSDGKWEISTWEETFGEQRRYENEQWVSEHPDTLVLAPAIEPSFVKKYGSLTEKDFKSFVKEWKDWSNQLRSCSTDSLINQAIKRVFKDYSENNLDTCALYSLPNSIEIRRYPGSFKDFPFDDSWDKTTAWDYMMEASKRFAYVPSFDSERAIVYLTPDIKRLLSLYIGGVSESEEDDFTDDTRWTEINEDRLSALGDLIQVHRGHWGGHWHLCSMPQLFSLYFYDDGFVADFRTSWCTGETVFYPDDLKKEKVSLSDWIE